MPAFITERRLIVSAISLFVLILVLFLYTMLTGNEEEAEETEGTPPTENNEPLVEETEEPPEDTSSSNTPSEINESEDPTGSHEDWEPASDIFHQSDNTEDMVGLSLSSPSLVRGVDMPDVRYNIVGAHEDLLFLLTRDRELYSHDVAGEKTSLLAEGILSAQVEDEEYLLAVQETTDGFYTFTYDVDNPHDGYTELLQTDSAPLEVRVVSNTFLFETFEDEGTLHMHPYPERASESLIDMSSMDKLHQLQSFQGDIVGLNAETLETFRMQDIHSIDNWMDLDSVDGKEPNLISIPPSQSADRILIGYGQTSHSSGAEALYQNQEKLDDIHYASEVTWINDRYFLYVSDAFGSELYLYDTDDQESFLIDGDAYSHSFDDTTNTLYYHDEVRDEPTAIRFDEE